MSSTGAFNRLKSQPRSIPVLLMFDPLLYKLMMLLSIKPSKGLLQIIKNTSRVWDNMVFHWFNEEIKFLFQLETVKFAQQKCPFKKDSVYSVLAAMHYLQNATIQTLRQTNQKLNPFRWLWGDNETQNEIHTQKHQDHNNKKSLLFRNDICINC